MNLKIPVSPNLDLWKRFRISFCYEFIEKRQSYQGTLGLFGSFGPLRLYVQRERVFFVYLASRTLCKHLLEILKQKEKICMGEGSNEKML